MAERCCAEDDKHNKENNKEKEKETAKGEKNPVGNVTCPKCGHMQPMEIPLKSCQAFYLCGGCGKTISAEKSCCVFCDYGDRKCPVAEEHKT